jgi:hypothetical protein
MNLSEWIEHDFAVIDATQTVTFARPGMSVVVAGVKSQALRREAIERLAPTCGIESTYRSFSLPVVNLGDVSPSPGDTLRDQSDSVWRVVTAKLSTADTRWVVVCILAR